MSSASAGSTGDKSGDDKNFADVDGGAADFAATSTVAAEAQQGEGPTAASASSSAVSESAARTSTASVCVGADYAAASCDFGAVAVGPQSAAAASQVGVVAVAPSGAAATSNSANSSTVETGGDRALAWGHESDAPPPAEGPAQTTKQTTTKEKR